MNLKVHCRPHNSHHFFSDWTTWIHSTPSYSIYLRSTLILPSHLSRGLQSGLFPLFSSTETLHAYLFTAHTLYALAIVSPICYITLFRWIKIIQHSEARGLSNWNIRTHLLPHEKHTASTLQSIIIIIFLHALGRLTCSGSDALPSFPGASTISSSSRFVVEGVFRESGVGHSFKMVDYK